MAGSSLICQVILYTLLSIGFNFLLCNFHPSHKLLNINIKCPRALSPAFSSTGCMFSASVVKKLILAVFELMVSICFVLGFFSVLLLSFLLLQTIQFLALLFSKHVCIWAFLRVPSSLNTCTSPCFLQNFVICTDLVPVSPSDFLLPSSNQSGNSSYVFQLNHPI